MKRIATIWAFSILTIAGFVLARGAAHEPLVEMPPLRLHKHDDHKPATETVVDGFNYDPSTEILPSALERAAAVPARRVRRWQWRDDSAVRGQLWNVGDVESVETLAAGLLRVCTAEAEGNALDCVGIWQTIRAIRNTSCNRARVPEITECYDDGTGETLLSAMRRAQKRVMGMVAPTRQRQVWIANLTPACDEPAGYGSRHPWNPERCRETAAVARRLATGETRPRLPNRATPITWGGTFDDHIACGRGLARIPNTGDGGDNTHNTFWCRPGSRGCPAQSDCPSSDDDGSFDELLDELLASDEPEPRAARERS